MCTNCGKLRGQVVSMDCEEVEKTISSGGGEIIDAALIHIFNQLSTHYPQSYTQPVGLLSTREKPENTSRKIKNYPVIPASTITTVNLSYNLVR